MSPGGGRVVRSGVSRDSFVIKCLWSLFSIREKARKGYQGRKMPVLAVVNVEACVKWDVVPESFVSGLPGSRTGTVNGSSGNVDRSELSRKLSPR